MPLVPHNEALDNRHNMLYSITCDMECPHDIPRSDSDGCADNWTR